MADKRIDIDIKTTADSKGAKQAADDIKKLGEATQQSAEAYSTELKEVRDEYAALAKELEEIRQLNQDAGFLGGSGEYEAANELAQEASARYEVYKTQLQETEELEKLLIAAQKESNEVVEEKVVKLEGLTEELEDTSDAVKDYSDELKKSEKQTKKTTKEGKKLEDVILDLDPKTKSLANKFKGLGSVFRFLKIGAVLKGFDLLGQKLRSASDYTRDLNRDLKDTNSSWSGFASGAAAATSGLATFVEAINNSINPIRTFGNLSDAWSGYREELSRAAESARKLKETQDNLLTQLETINQNRIDIAQKALDEAKAQENILRDLKETEEIQRRLALSRAAQSDETRDDIVLLQQQASRLKENLKLQAELAKNQIEAGPGDAEDKAARTRGVEERLSEALLSIDNQLSKGIVDSKKELLVVLNKEVDASLKELERLTIAQTGVLSAVEEGEITKKIVELQREKYKIRQQADAENRQLFDEENDAIKALNKQRLFLVSRLETSDQNLKEANVKDKKQFDILLQNTQARVTASKESVETLEEGIESINADTIAANINAEIQKKIAQTNQKILKNNEERLNAYEKEKDALDENIKQAEQEREVSGALASEKLRQIAEGVGKSGQVGGLSQQDYLNLADVFEDGIVSAEEAAKFGPLITKFGQLNKRWAQGTIGVIKDLITETQTLGSELENLRRQVKNNRKPK